jgi:hypothetical protein
VYASVIVGSRAGRRVIIRARSRPGADERAAAV